MSSSQVGPPCLPQRTTLRPEIDSTCQSHIQRGYIHIRSDTSRPTWIPRPCSITLSIKSHPGAQQVDRAVQDTKLPEQKSVCQAVSPNSDSGALQQGHWRPAVTIDLPLKRSLESSHLLLTISFLTPSGSIENTLPSVSQCRCVCIYACLHLKGR